MNKQELSKKINDLLILKEGDSYFLFGKYSINVTDIGYKVTKKGDENTKTFYTLQNAFSWCVFDKNLKASYLTKLEELDILVSSLDVVIAQHKKLLEKHMNSPDKYIYLAKLGEERYKKRRAMEEIKSYIISSKRLQNKKYDENEPR